MRRLLYKIKSFDISRWRIKMRRRYCRGKSPCWNTGQWGCTCRHSPNSIHYKGRGKENPIKTVTVKEAEPPTDFED